MWRGGRLSTSVAHGSSAQPGKRQSEKRRWSGGCGRSVPERERHTRRRTFAEPRALAGGRVSEAEQTRLDQVARADSLREGGELLAQRGRLCPFGEARYAVVEWLLRVDSCGARESCMTAKQAGARREEDKITTRRTVSSDTFDSGAAFVMNYMLVIIKFAVRIINSFSRPHNCIRKEI